MSKQDTSRLIFKKGSQKAFLIRAKNILEISHVDLAKLLKINPRTLSDWKREKFSMPLVTIKKVARLAKISIPADAEKKDRYWYTTNGGKVGGNALYKKYGHIGGDPKKRIEAWHKWWDKIGKFRKNQISNISIPIIKPGKSVLLAEFCGIVLGDGGITKNQVTISLNKETDAEYTLLVAKMIEKLFGVKPSIYKRKDKLVNDVVVSRSNLVKFCVEILGLKQGHKIKQQIDIPEWIKKEKKYYIACIRGLVDTDGCVFTHSYIVGGKMYHYKKLSFTSMSNPLLHSVHKILRSLGFSSHITHQGQDVRLDRVADTKKYFKIIGTSNPKHLYRYHN